MRRSGKRRLARSCIAALIGSMLSFSAAMADSPPRPNILLIVAEDSGLQYGCYGDHTVPTPHVDRLAAQGTRFENAYVTQAVCSPSRSTILTGLYPHQNGQLGLATSRFTMTREWPTLPTLLKQAGYRTGLIGKLHVLPESAFAFDFRWNEPSSISFRSRDVRRTAEVAGQFIAADAQPFFLMVNYADAHLPFLPQSAGLPKTLVQPEQVTMFPAVGVDSPRLRRHLADYYDCMSRLDAGVGMVLDELDRSGKADQTLVVYLSDHGPQFARGKTTSYELGLRVPLIVRWSGVAGEGLVRPELVSAIDLMPTLLAAAGATVPDNLSGRSLRPLLSGEKVSDWRQYLFAEWNTGGITPTGATLLFPQRTVRDDRYKLVVSLLPGPNKSETYYTLERRIETGPTQAEIDAAPTEIRRTYATWRDAPPVELYDLQSDPYELANLAGRTELAQVQSRLMTALAEWRQTTGDPLLDPVKLEQLVAENRAHLQTVTGQGKNAAFEWDYPRYLYPQQP